MTAEKTIAALQNGIKYHLIKMRVLKKPVTLKIVLFE